jgi:TRAP transporter T-component
VLVAALSACSPRELILREVGNALASTGSGDEEDLLLARDAAPFFLKTSESVLRETPDHLGLAAAVAGGFTRYAYAFVAFEADRLEPADARAARQMRQRAARLYRRAHLHAMHALEARHPGLRARLARGGPGLELADAEVAVAYWAAASWGAWISLAKNEPDVVADLPSALRLAQIAHARAPDALGGDLATLLGTLEATRPGGERLRAERYFAEARAASADRNAGVFVAMAESLALPAGDRAGFEALLRAAGRAAQGRSDPSSQVMNERARWLLGRADDLF